MISTHQAALHSVVLQQAGFSGSDAQIQQAQRLLQIGNMTTSIAHDLNNLLAVIEASASLAAESLPASHDTQHDLAAISQASRRSSRLVRQILAFARQQQPPTFPIHLGEALAGIDLLIERIIGPNISLERDLAPDLWLITAAPGQIEQVLINLLSNAREALPSGGRVTVRAHNYIDHDGAGMVRLEVVDDGVGIAAEQYPNLFEPFYTTRPAGKSIGLGLPICAAIVAQIGGKIELESAVGRGTSARVLLPRIMP